jgi:hypothetical protein
MDCDTNQEDTTESSASVQEQQLVAAATTPPKEEEEDSEYYKQIRTELEEKLIEMHMQREQLLEQKKDASFIEEAIRDFETFMAKQLLELDNLMANKRKKVKVKAANRKPKKRVVDDFESGGLSNTKQLLLLDKDGDLAVEQDEESSAPMQPTKKSKQALPLRKLMGL